MQVIFSLPESGGIKMTGERCAVTMHRLMHPWPLLNTMVGVALRERLVSIYNNLTNIRKPFHLLYSRNAVLRREIHHKRIVTRTVALKMFFFQHPHTISK